MEAISSIMLLLVLFRQRTRFRLYQMKPPWVNNVSRSGYGSRSLHMCIIIMVIMEFLRQIFFQKLWKKSQSQSFMVLDHSTRTLIWSMQFSISCIWNSPLWCMHCFIGIIAGLMIYRCCLLPPNTLPGSTIECLTINMVWLFWNLSQKLRRTILTCYICTSRVVWLVFLFLNLKTIRDFKMELMIATKTINRFLWWAFIFVCKFFHIQNGYISLQYDDVFENNFIKFLVPKRMMCLLMPFLMIYGTTVVISTPKTEYENGKLVCKPLPLNEVWIDEPTQACDPPS